MFFYVKYIDYEDFQKTEDLESLASELLDVFPTENKVLLVNPDCFIGIILDYVFDAAGIEEDLRSDFDLSNAKVKTLNIHSYPLDHNASDIFTERVTYYVVYCDKQRERIRPLLSISSKEYGAFMEYQKRKTSSLKSIRSRSKSSRLSSRQSLSKKGSASTKSSKSINSKSKSLL